MKATSEIRSLASKISREAAALAATGAILFLIGAWGCFHWVYSRGSFGDAIEVRQVNLMAPSTVDVRFSVPYRGDHEIKLWFSREASDDVDKDLDGILGKATLFTGGNLVEEVALPVRHHTCTRDGCGMIVFTGPTEPRAQYRLQLQVDRMPGSLARSHASVKVDLVPDYYLLFLELEVIAALLLLAALSCGFLTVRWRKMSMSPNGRDNTE